GMEEEKVADIYRLFESEDPGIKDEHNWQSIGIKNVNDRIRYMYGEDYGLSITSTVNVGTNVTITLPMIRESKLDA
ncbi:MAG: sensor histidine kinase, partial [Butyrivibrio sp.]|nr:sensor histidine kinase [Butyrivibrio sp.]